MADRYLWPCCECCNGIALDDHVDHGGHIEKDGHDGPCTTCQQDRRIRVTPPDVG